jgi:hypothetical protein
MGGKQEFATNNLIDGLAWATPARDITDPVKLDNLLRGLRLLGSDDARAKNKTLPWNGKTPASLQVIESGTLQVTQHLTKVAKAAGGWGSLVLVLSGGLTTGLQQAHVAGISNSVIVTLFGGAFVLASATAIALAVLVGADLLARGNASAARTSARGQVTAAFLQATASLPGAVKTTADDAKPQAVVAKPQCDAPKPAEVAAKAAAAISEPAETTPAAPPQPKMMWVLPVPVPDGPNQWRPVLGYEMTTTEDPPQREVFVLLQDDPSQPPTWRSSGEIGGWRFAAAAPDAGV